MTLTVVSTVPDGEDVTTVGEWFQQSLLRAAEEDRQEGVIRDVNGNTVGTWSVT